MESFIGKKVEVKVAFGGYTVDGGSTPRNFVGVLKKVDGDFLVFSEVKAEKIVFTSRSFEDYSNNATINKQYIIMIAEV